MLQPFLSILQYFDLIASLSNFYVCLFVLFSFCIKLSAAENEISQQDLAMAISRSLAYIWQTLEKLLTRQIAEVYTDLVGPLRQLVESASPSSGNLPDQNDYNVKMKEFLVSVN